MASFVCRGCGTWFDVTDDEAACPGCGRGVAPVHDTILAAPPRHVPEEPAWPLTDHEIDLGSDTFAVRGRARHAVAVHAPELTDFLAPAQRADEIGRLGTYRVLSVLDRGGMGVVFRAQDPGLDRLVALKAMLPNLAGNRAARERFFREAKAAAALKHPNVVTIFQVGEDRGAPFLAMELLEGESLDRRIQREGRLPPAEVVRIGREAAAGLAAAHARGLVHRDVKPSNIWLEGPEGRVKLLDFGLARPQTDGPELTGTGHVLGTPAHMAPEQAEGLAVDHRCDLFSLGTVLYRMATGRLPFEGDTAFAVLLALGVKTPKPPHELNPDVPRPLSDLIVRLMDKDSRGVPPRPPRSSRRSPRRLPARVPARPPRPWLVPVALALAVVLTAGLADALKRPTPPEPAPAAAAEWPGSFTNDLGMEFVRVPRGRAWFGEREVEVPHDFYLGKYEVTQEQWQRVMGANPSNFARDGGEKERVKGVSDDDLKRFPVEQVSWLDTRLFLAELNKRERATGWLYRLPTETEWEYACRGGPAVHRAAEAFEFYHERPTTRLEASAGNFAETNFGRTCKVGSYPPNRLGLHDMHGNVWEWVEGADTGKDGEVRRVYRGGSWIDGPDRCRASSRDNHTPDFWYGTIGLRVARVRAGE